MRKPFWKQLFPQSVQSVPGQGTAARQKAEQDLVQTRQELAKTQAQTPYYAGLGYALRVERERNHIAERIRISLRGV